MFREMRRKAQQISTEECMEILLNAKTGVLGLHGEDGYPYTVPVNFVYTPPGTGNGPVSDSDGSADKGNGSNRVKRKTDRLPQETGIACSGRSAFTARKQDTRLTRSGPTTEFLLQ